MTKSFIQSSDALFGAQLRNFYIKLINLVTLLGFTPDELTEAKDDSMYLDYLMDADRPIQTYVKKAYQGSVIYKDTGDGYTYLGTAFKSKFEDNNQLPEPGTSSIWKYKAIFVWDGKETGHWSD